jgi:hypothetical protein
MQKTYLFSVQIGMPQANALKSIGYTDTVGTYCFLLLVTQISISIKVNASQQQFLSGCPKLPKLAADLPYLFCDRYPAY